MATIEQKSPGRYVMKDLYLFTLGRDDLNRRLESLPVKVRPLSIKPHSALRRALSLSLDQSLYTFEESSVEKIDGKPVFLVLSREAIRGEEVDPTRAKAFIKPNGLEVETSYPDLRRAIHDGFRFHMDNAITRDLSKAVSAYMTECMGITVRPNNGEVYFVLEQYITEINALTSMIDDIGQQSTLRISPVVGVEVKKVTQTAHEYFKRATERLEKVTMELSEDSHTRTLNTRLKDVAQLMEQVKAYRIGLGMELQSIDKRLKEAEERVTMRLMGRQTKGKTDPDEKPAEISAPGSPDTQMALI